MGRVARIVSGGQTGADRAALDVAISLGIPYGGWCPRGGWAEDLHEPPGVLARYPLLQEAVEPAPSRTLLNARDSDATLIVRAAATGSPGTDLTAAHAEQLGRPLLVTSGADPTVVHDWLEGLDGEITLNVAGPRESEQPGVYETAKSLLLAVLG